MALNWLRPSSHSAANQPLGGRYRILQELGAGGFGKTFLAEDLHLPGQPRCVVKQLHPQMTDPESLQTARRLFDTEAQVLYQLGNHSQIPQLLAHFEQNQEFYLAQEWIDGHSLSAELVTGRQWTPNQVVGLLVDLLDTLAFVHQQEVIHRDLKPANLMRRRSDQRIVLIDFGAVKQATGLNQATTVGNTNLTISIGTKGYMPNEQLGGSPRFSSDVYAVGMIALQALSGIHPKHYGEDPRTGELQWPAGLEDAPSELRDVINRMVRYDFRDRYPAAAEALAAVQALPDHLQPEAAPLLTGDSEDTEISPAPILPQPSPSIPNSNAPTLAIAGQPPGTATLPRTQPGGSSATTPVSTKSLVVGGSIAGVLAIALIGVGLTRLTPADRSTPGESAALEETLPAAEAPPSAPATEPETTAPPNPEAPAAAPAQTPGKSIANGLDTAQQHSDAGRHDQALAAYDRAIAAAADNAQAQWGRCFSLNNLQRYNEAIAACDAALAIDPSNAQAAWSKGYALEALGQLDAALAQYDQAIGQDGQFAEAWSNKGTVLFKLGRAAEAIAAFDQAIALDATLAEAWNNRGAALWQLGDRQAAIQSIEQALEINPNYADAQNLRSQIREMIGQ